MQEKYAEKLGLTSEDIGLNADTMNVIINVTAQSPEIAHSVHEDKNAKDLGAGDQVIMFGYATDESEELFPLTHLYASRMAQRFNDLRTSGEIHWLRPDCKTQITMEYHKDGGHITPKRVHNVVISAQHAPEAEDIEETLIEKVVKHAIPSKYLVDTEYLMNPSKSFIKGGPDADAGLTGRKIIVDTYGGWWPHGGDAFSGKDSSKVDRSSSYNCRYVAKSLVHAGLANRVLIQVSYAIGIVHPLSIYVDSYGTAKEGLDDSDLTDIVKKNFDFRPYNMIKVLDLKRPIFRKTAKFGYFGRNDPDFTWETLKKLNLD